MNGDKIETKICSKCQIPKELKHFAKDKYQNSGYQCRCKICFKEIYLANRERNLANSKAFKNKDDYAKKDYIKNKNKYTKYFKDRVKNNPEYYQNYANKNKDRILEYDNERRKNNPQVRIVKSLRHRVWTYVKKEDKKLHSLELLGCNTKFYKQYLEDQFKPEMSWDNYGIVWEIDHIIGCCNFNLTILEEQQKCFHYSNTRPIFRTTQIAESFGYTDEIGNRNRTKR